MKLSGNALSVAEKIIDQFRNPETLPAKVATLFITRKESHIPAAKWSWLNRLAILLEGHTDARGYKQWGEIGRNVRKGEKACHILVPMMRKQDPKEGESGEAKTIVYGFRTVPVFGLDQTDGEPIADLNPELTKWVENLPLREVAEAWGIEVDTYSGRGASMAGFYQFQGTRGFHGERIGLGVLNLSTWLHELTHAADHRLVGLKGGQDAEQEIVAELGGAVLASLLGMEKEADLGRCWEYVQRYSKGNSSKAVQACSKLLQRVCDAVELILNTAEGVGEESELETPQRG